MSYMVKKEREGKMAVGYLQTARREIFVPV
jgi:hypothetical protein